MFQSQQINEYVYKIIGRGCDCYLVLGDEEAIMIDSGCDRHNIIAYAHTLVNLPITTVINTHSHFDHTGGNGFFDKIYMSEKSSYSAKNYMDENPTGLLLDYPIEFIKEGNFTFSGIDFYILELNCHSPGNIAILDKTHRILFAGDEIDADQVLLLPGFAEKAGQLHSCPAATVSDYQKALYKMKEFEQEYEIICSGHNGSPLDKEIINNMIELCNQILKGEKGNANCSSETYSKRDTHYPYLQANYLRYTWKNCSLVYCDDHLYERRKNSRFKPATPLHLLCADTWHFI